MRFILFALLSFFSCNLFAQLPGIATDSIALKMYWYALQKPSSTLFVHFDKTVYTNTEYAWFTAYLLKSSKGADPQTLSAALVRNADRSVLSEVKIVMRSGLAYGNLYIPDSLPTGDYSIISYTDHLLDGYPTDVFVQPITIKTNNTEGFIANLTLTDSVKTNKDSIRVLLKAYTKDVTLVKNADVSYFVGDRKNPVTTGKLKTDNFGEAVFSIPAKKISGVNNVLQTEISNGKDIKAFSIKLPVYKQHAVVNFYPEGGNLVTGEKCTVGWEVFNNEGEPLQVSAALFKDDKPAEVVTTDAYGIGRFDVIPVEKSHYYIKLLTVDYAKDTVFTLPAPLPEGPVAKIVEALTSDTLNIRLHARNTGSKWSLIIHDYKTVFLTTSITASSSSILVKVPLDDVPKGLQTFTLVDDLGRPWAERIFFAHYNKTALVDISTDTTVYEPRQKVQLRFKVSGVNGDSLKGLVSIACAQDNRFEAKKMTDIVSYTYLRHELTSFPFRNKLLNNDADSKSYLENLLLIKGWRRYSWTDLVKVQAKDTVHQLTEMTFKGTVAIEGKPTKKPVELNLLRAPLIYPFKTDTVGNFNLSTNDIILKPQETFRIYVSNNYNKHEQYRIRIVDPFKLTNKRIAEQIPFERYERKVFGESSQVTTINKEERAKRLIDVTVTSKKNLNYAANVCGDYVCVANVLNCPNHPYGGTEPELGVRYKTGRGSVIYSGCVGMKYLTIIDGIYTKKEFYVHDFENAEEGGDAYFSTMYWNHSLLTNGSGEAEVSFYTNDIPGKFRIVIQGITSKNMLVYGEHFITVVKQ